MIPGMTRFADLTEREAYSVPSGEVGKTFYQLSDGSFWRAKTEGAGAASWARLTGNNKVVAQVSDVVALNGTATFVCPSPVAGKIVLLQSVLDGGALATGDATLTGKIAGVAITGGVITITQSGSATNDVDSAAPSAANTVAVGDLIGVTVGGSNSAARTARVWAVIEEY